MKNYKLFMILCAAMAAFSACSDDKDDPVYSNDPQSSLWSFSGDVAVVQRDESTFTDKDKVTVIKFNADKTKCDVIIYVVKFASAMPVTIDMHIDGMDVTAITGGGYRITGNNIVPYDQNDDPNERYTVFNFAGTASVDSFDYSLTCGGHEEKYPAYPVSSKTKAIDPKDAVTITGGSFKGHNVEPGLATGN